MKRIDVESGELVLVRGRDGDVRKVSIPEVGHALAEGAVIIDRDGNEIPPTEMRARRVINGVPFTARVVDPGSQYSVCFLQETAGHLARLFKA